MDLRIITVVTEQLVLYIKILQLDELYSWSPGHCGDYHKFMSIVYVCKIFILSVACEIRIKWYVHKMQRSVL